MDGSGVYLSVCFVEVAATTVVYALFIHDAPPIFGGGECSGLLAGAYLGAVGLGGGKLGACALFLLRGSGVGCGGENDLSS